MSPSRNVHGTVYWTTKRSVLDVHIIAPNPHGFCVCCLFVLLTFERFQS